MNRRHLLVLTFAIATIIAITITVCAATIPSGATYITEPETTISEAYIPSETSFEEETTIPEEEVIILEVVEVERVEPTTLEEANRLLDDAIFRRDTADLVYKGLLSLGYEGEHPAVVMAATGLENAELDCTFYEEWQSIRQEEEYWRVRTEEYPVATQVWLYMKNELGFSDIVCAGIMGNMMAECGGCWTSDLDWDVSSSSGYGMIQWLGGRRSQLFSIYGNTPSVENQLDFMFDELYGTDGVTKQVTDSQLDKIMNASNPEDCAYAFACYYERCGEGHRWVRRDYARRAYEYFVG